jgi:hypothetical protein
MSKMLAKAGKQRIKVRWLTKKTKWAVGVSGQRPQKKGNLTLEAFYRTI